MWPVTYKKFKKNDYDAIIKREIVMFIFSSLFRYKDRKTPDKLGLYPLLFHIKAMPERRYLWTARVLAIVATINISLMIVLTMIIYLLLPQKGARPLLYRQNNTELQQIMPQTVWISPRRLLIESHIRQFVDMQHSLPKKFGEFYARWSENSLFRAYCSDEVYNSFKSNLQTDMIKKMIAKHITQDVEVEDIKNIYNDFYIVTFRIITKFPDKDDVTISRWHAYMHISYQNYGQNITPQQLLNPHGFKVLSYDVGYIGTSNPK